MSKRRTFLTVLKNDNDEKKGFRGKLTENWKIVVKTETRTFLRGGFQFAPNRILSRHARVPALPSTFRFRTFPVVCLF
jgi:hypothetical protein